MFRYRLFCSWRCPDRRSNIMSRRATGGAEAEVDLRSGDVWEFKACVHTDYGVSILADLSSVFDAASLKAFDGVVAH